MIELLKKMFKTGAPSAGWLVCSKCPFKLHVTQEDAAKLIADGLPLHCGETVGFEPGRAIVNVKDEPEAAPPEPETPAEPKKKKKKG
jgi:hypothetical protein